MYEITIILLIMLLLISNWELVIYIFLIYILILSYWLPSFYSVILIIIYGSALLILFIYIFMIFEEKKETNNLNIKLLVKYVTKNIFLELKWVRKLKPILSEKNINRMKELMLLFLIGLLTYKIIKLNILLETNNILEILYKTLYFIDLSFLIYTFFFILILLGLILNIILT